MKETYKTARVHKWKLLDKMKCGFSIGNHIFIGYTASDFLIKHEYGHTLQYKKLGGWKFFTTVQVPSFLWFWKRHRLEKGYMKKGLTQYDAIQMVNVDLGNYYSKPVEHEANILGGNY